MNPLTFNIILVEDDADLRESITRYIDDDGIAVTAVGDARGFYHSLEQTAFDVAVIDIGLPDQSGYVLVEYARRNTDIGVIILTARGKVEERVQGYAAGADLYLVKPVDMEELLAAILSLAKRRRETSQQPLMWASHWQLCPIKWCLVSPTGLEIELTGKEFELVKLFATANGQVIARQNLLASLGYAGDSLGSRALYELLYRLRRKILHQPGLEFPLKTQHAIGYCFSGSIGFR